MGSTPSPRGPFLSRGQLQATAGRSGESSNHNLPANHRLQQGEIRFAEWQMLHLLGVEVSKLIGFERDRAARAHLRGMTQELQQEIAVSMLASPHAHSDRKLPPQLPPTSPD